MTLSKYTFLMLASALLLGGCTWPGDLWDMVWPSAEAPEPEVVQIPPAPTQQAQLPPAPGPYYPPGQYPPPQYPPAQYPPPQYPQVTAPLPPPAAQVTQPLLPPGPPPPPPLGTTQFEPTPPTPGQPTGTFVGAKLAQLRQDLASLQGNISQHNAELQQVRNLTVQHSQGYWGVVAAVNSRLQVGTTPGNPVLVQQWNEAQAQLDRLNDDVLAMNSLGNKVAADSAMSAYLLESTRAAYGLSGSVDEDHRQLAILEDEVNQTVVLIDRLLNELNEDVQRQTDYVSRERTNLTTMSLAIKNGEMYGVSLANRAFRTSAPLVSGRAAAAATTVAGTPRRPLVVIRFDRPNVEYEQALYTAVSRALERRPEAAFDLVAVTPQAAGATDSALNSSTAKRSAETVLRSLTEMGLPADRITLSAMSSPEVRGNEVHVYVR
jgi:hypothetical protein